jgi:cytochrome c-type biogenesis protein CcmH
MGTFLFAAAALVAATMLLLLRPWRASALGRGTTLSIAMGVPLVALGGYALLGTPAALVAPPVPAADAAHEAGQIERMVAGLAARLQANPDDPKGWAMLGRSYHAMGRMADAQAAFERVGPALHQDATLLADYADVLAAQAGGALEGRPLELATAALRLEPDHPMALSLVATAAYKRKDFAQAATHWQRLLKQLPPDSEDARWLVKTLAEMGPPPSAPERATGKAVSGIVSLAPGLSAQVRPTDTVFVFARPLDGSRVPLAVQRARASELPLAFRLDDSMAMSPQNLLSAARQVRIEARVSRSGTATPAAGDLIGESEPVAPGETRVALTIDRARR